MYLNKDPDLMTIDSSPQKEDLFFNVYFCHRAATIPPRKDSGMLSIFLY